jgi:Tfp pilus assembly PilM family ATPase
MGLFGSMRERVIIGLDIGSRRIKAVEARGGKRPKVRRTAQVPTPEGAVQGGVVVQPERLATALKSVVQRLRAPAKEVAVAVGGSVAFLRRMPLPVMPAEELRSMLELQTDRFIPFAKEGAEFDLAILGEAGNGEMHVLLAAAPAKAVAGLMQACKAARLKLVKVDVEPLALQRGLVAAGCVGEFESIGILDLGHELARLSLFEDGKPLLTRNLELGPEFQQAQAEAREDENLPARLADLLLDLRRSLDFALAQYQGALPSRLLLVGGGARLPGLDRICTDYLRQNVARLPEEFAVLVPDLSLARLEPGELLAFGLALCKEGARA